MIVLGVVNHHGLTRLICLWTALMVALVDGGGRLSLFMLDQLDCAKDVIWETEIKPQLQGDPIYHQKVTHALPVNGSLKVKLARNPFDFLTSDIYVCKVGFTASKRDHHLLLSWDEFMVGAGLHGNDWMMVFDLETDFDFSGQLFGVKGEWDDNPRPPFKQNFKSISAGFSIAYRGHPQMDYVTILLTEYQDLERGRCGAGQYMCNTDPPMCISSLLRCNEDNNCGEGQETDERSDCYSVTAHCVHGTEADKNGECTRQPVHSQGGYILKNNEPVGLIGALLGIFVTATVVALVGVTVCLCKRRRRNQHTRNMQRGLNSLTLARAPRAENIYTPMPKSAGVSQSGSSTSFPRSSSHLNEADFLTVDFTRLNNERNVQNHGNRSLSHPRIVESTVHPEDDVRRHSQLAPSAPWLDSTEPLLESTAQSRDLTHRREPSGCSDTNHVYADVADTCKSNKHEYVNCGNSANQYSEIDDIHADAASQPPRGVEYANLNNLASNTTAVPPLRTSSSNDMAGVVPGARDYVNVDHDNADDSHPGDRLTLPPRITQNMPQYSPEILPLPTRILHPSVDCSNSSVEDENDLLDGT